MRQRSQRSVWLAWGLLASCLVACHDVRFGLGAVCNDTDDCDDRFICDRERCRPECTADVQCDEGACVAAVEDADRRVCTVPDEADCSERTGAEQCPQSLTCAADGICRDPCESCGAGQVCHAGACFDEVPDLPEPDAGEPPGDAGGGGDAGMPPPDGGEPLCGNGEIDDGEHCDPPGTCPASAECVFDDACIVATYTGSAAECTARCQMSAIGACADADGCCPAGCDYDRDDDCSADCGDGVVDPAMNETCEPGSATPCSADCDDADACTTDTMSGSAANCNVRCTHVPLGPGVDASGEGSCTCFAGWTGATCDACDSGYYGGSCTACPSCGAHGACRDGLVGDGQCACDTGWTGAGCDACEAGRWGASCETCPSCGAHGACRDGLVGDGQCACDTGFTGASCDTCDAGRWGPSCAACPSCGAHGSCRDGLGGNGQCACDAGWTGASCNACASGYYGASCTACASCGAHGSCNDGLGGNGQCACDTGWTGAACDQCASDYYSAACLACPSCGTHGSCNDGLLGSGTCACDAGWTGASCNACASGYYGASCAACASCGANGSCRDGLGGNGTCACDTGWTGASCNACASGYYGASCTACASCGANGSCNDGLGGNGQCACTGGWTGTLCDVPPSGTTECMGLNDITDASKWSTFDVSTVNSGARGFRTGGVFDGRFLYLVPFNNGSPSGLVARYDTQAPLGSPAAWSTFDVEGVDTRARSFAGGTFDGRYVYFPSGAFQDGVVTRYDTQAPFGAAASWSTFSVATVNASAKSWGTPTFDGRYVYLPPNASSTDPSIMARYDTQAAFGSAGSWSTFDLSSLETNLRLFTGAVFDGRYLYVVPSMSVSERIGIVPRYDTQAPFASAGSWTTFDAATVNAGAEGFAGGSFDGRYVYLVPYYNDAGYHGIVARYDTQAAFGSVASWSTFDVSTVNAAAEGFYGAAFDGRYMYLSPQHNGSPSGTLARYDTRAAFGSAASWSIFDVSTVNAAAEGFGNQPVFDGRYVYLVPYDNDSGPHGTLTRFDAKGCDRPRSCAGLPLRCGPGLNEDCCASPLVTGGAFYRSYDGVTFTDQSSPATVSDFRLDKYEVTVGRFRKFKAAWDGGWRPSAGDGRHTHLNGGSGLVDSGAAGYEAGWDTAWASGVAPTNGNLSCDANQTWTSGVGTNENRPINCANWYELHAFCIWDGGFLPSEAEWNYAAAGGSEQRVYPWSSPPASTSIDCTRASYGCETNACGDGAVGCGPLDMVPVGTKAAGVGRFGQVDMAGNAWEWVLDGHAPYVTPCDDGAQLSVTSSRAQRGGYFGDVAYVQTAQRGNPLPPTGRDGYMGARCARAPGTTYNAIIDASKWSTFDVSTVNSGAEGYWGAAFDGRYLYLVPWASDLAVRYDTQVTLGSAGAWSTFDVSTVSSGARGFNGAAFDGRYLYLIPHRRDANYHGNVARYDTQATFSSAASWSVFDVSTVSSGARGFAGAAFDGRYLYLVPHENPAGQFSSIVARYDTQATFSSASSWSMFDVSTVNSGAVGFAGAAFDGRYLYLAPFANAPGAAGTHGIVARYDTQAAFGSAGAWSTFDVSTVNSGARGFIGAAFDGRHLYLVPYTGDSGRHGIVARYDTQAAFGSAGAWSTFDVATINPDAQGFYGAAFDGRHLYLVPLHDGDAYHGVLARYDTQAAFGSAGAWSAFDVSTVNSGPRGFVGAAFDGQYLYLVPYGDESGPHGIVTRFDAKSPPLLPSGWSHSFF